MTVCVAAFAAKSRAIAMISDKALSFGAMVSATKIAKLAQVGDSSWHAMIAGDIAIADEIIMESVTNFKAGDAGSSASMMLLMSRAYQSVYQRHFTAQVFAPRLMTPADLFQRERKLIPLSEIMERDLRVEVETFRKEWDCSLLVCGFDSKGEAHIFDVEPPGRAFSQNRNGFSAIGIGADAAIGRLLWLETDRNQPLDQVLYEAFDAKVQAEIIQFVSYEWDAHVLLPPRDGDCAAKRIDEKITGMMDLVFPYLNRSPYDREKFDKDETPPKNWKRQLKRFCDELLVVLDSGK